jgi:hypothetical protein
MILLIEENTYHQDILQCYRANIDALDVMIFSGRVVESDSDFYKFNFFTLFFLLLTKDIERVCFNTLEKPKSAVLAVLCSLMKIKFEFVCHNFDGFYEFDFEKTKKKHFFYIVFGRFLLSRASKIFLLTEDVFQFVSSVIPEDIKCKVGLLSIDRLVDESALLNTTEQEYYCVLGSVDYKRRDYGTLINFVKSSLKVKEKVYILGNANDLNGTDFIEKIEAESLADKFVLFYEYLPNQTFMSHLINAKAVIDISKGIKYGRIKSSSTAILSKAHNKKLIFLDK